MMKTDLMPNGNLRLLMQEEKDHQTLRELIRAHGHDQLGLLGDLLKRCGEPRARQTPQVLPLHPRKSGAWTDVPVLAEVKETPLLGDARGERSEVDAEVEDLRLWSYPVQSVYSLTDALVRRGYVDFVPVH